ncbi:ribosomal rna processing protein 36 [Citrus sinensis]|uniref:Ribosomal rna processing protein 36 n=1 Tax=Citrus sinensis TaxID=2711 RepID=A0ACB8MYF9_CITSI|nr:ribosomal rna processing protein 36 [Citrus sinensis]
MRELNDAIVSSRKIKFEEFKEEDHKTTSVSSSEEKDEIERELAEIRFEDLQKARSDGLNLVYRKINQANKNRPMANGAKQLVIRFRKVVQAPKRVYAFALVVCDSRIESLCGNLHFEGFRKRYYFLFENNLPAGKEELKKQLKKSIDANAIENMKKWISWIFESAKSTDATLLAKQKKKERAELESFIEKRSNNAAEDHIRMPYRRPINND